MTEPLKKSIEIKCDIAHAFETFVGQIDLWWPVGHRKFDQSTLSLEPKLGGQFIERSVDGQMMKMGEVVLYEAPNHIQYTWFPGAVKLPTLVDIKFSQQGEYSLVEVTHSEAESALGDMWPQRVSIFNRSWDVILDTLKTFIDEEK